MCSMPTPGGSVAPDRAAAGCRSSRAQAVLLIETASASVPDEMYAGQSASGPAWAQAGRQSKESAAGTPALAEDPLGAVAAERAAALERALPKGWRVLHAIHGGQPSISEALRTVREFGIERLVVIPMRPEFSRAVTGSELAELYRCLGESGSDVHVEVRSWWHDDTGYIDAHARLIHDCASGRGLTPLNSVLVFWAETTTPDGAGAALEARHVADGAELLRRRLGWPAERATTLITGAHRPGAEVSTLLGAVDSLGADGETAVLICPLTHMGRGVQLAGELESLLGPYRSEGGGPAHVCPAPDASGEFIKALSLLVRRGRQSTADLRNEPAPLFAPVDVRAVVEKEVGTLIMAGVCVRCPLGAGSGPALHHCDVNDLRRFKRPHLETIALLRRVAESMGVRECWIWNTCSRYELYAWMPAGATPEVCRAALTRAMDEVLGPGAARQANLLSGRAAWRHAFRTAAGLNSAMIGDAEVVEQLRAARGAAQYAGTAGELTDGFIEGIAGAVRELRDSTPWGRYEHHYCDVALSRLTPLVQGDITKARCLVVGGSTTSCSALESLVGRFRVPRRNLSLIYRGHRKGALVKRLHSAVGEGAVAVVDDYSSPEVLKAIADADLVVFALDQRQAAFTTRALAACRDLGSRPLTVVDFNTFGSVAADGPVPGLRLVDAASIDDEVSIFNRELVVDQHLATAVHEAEVWIGRHIGGAAESECSSPGGCRACTNRSCGFSVAKEHP